MDNEFFTVTDPQLSDQHMADQLPRRGEHVFQQEVTLTAHLVYTDLNDGDSILVFGYYVPTNYLPLLVAMTFGIMMILAMLSVLALWRYCWLPRRQHHIPAVEYRKDSSTRQEARRNGLLRVFRNGPWAYVSVGPTSNVPASIWTSPDPPTHKSPLNHPTTKPNLEQESPTYVRQISPSNSITINLNENNNV